MFRFYGWFGKKGSGLLGATLGKRDSSFYGSPLGRMKGRRLEGKRRSERAASEVFTWGIIFLSPYTLIKHKRCSGAIQGYGQAIQ